MRRLCVVVVALVCVPVLVPTSAADEQLRAPKELWNAYPLQPNSHVLAPVPSHPLRPPVGAAVDSPAADGDPGWLLPLGLGTALTAVLLSAWGLVTVNQRHTRPHRGATVRQYAPVGVVPEPTASPLEAVPYVTRRSGLIRSRYVVMVEEEGRAHALRRSRPFWVIGHAAAQLRSAEAAWDDLANDLRADGWEVDTAGRYEYYVPLRRAIVTTLEPYIRGEPADSGEA